MAACNWATARRIWRMDWRLCLTSFCEMMSLHVVDVPSKPELCCIYFSGNLESSLYAFMIIVKRNRTQLVRFQIVSVEFNCLGVKTFNGNAKRYLLSWIGDWTDFALLMLQFQTHGTILKIEFNYVKAACVTSFSRFCACAAQALVHTVETREPVAWNLASRHKTRN